MHGQLRELLEQGLVEDTLDTCDRRCGWHRVKQCSVEELLGSCKQRIEFPEPCNTPSSAHPGERAPAIVVIR